MQDNETHEVCATGPPAPTPDIAEQKTKKQIEREKRTAAQKKKRQDPAYNDAANAKRRDRNRNKASARRALLIPTSNCKAKGLAIFYSLTLFLLDNVF